MAGPDEQENRARGGEGGKVEIQEVGYKYLGISHGGPPTPIHPAASRADWRRCTPGQEEPWGGRRRDGLGTLFLETIGVTSSAVAFTCNPCGFSF